jgi:hypothetical protein
MILMNFESNYKYCSHILSFHIFSLIFVLITYSLKYDVDLQKQGCQTDYEGVSQWTEEVGPPR